MGDCLRRGSALHFAELPKENNIILKCVALRKFVGTNILKRLPWATIDKRAELAETACINAL